MSNRIHYSRDIWRRVIFGALAVLNLTVTINIKITKPISMMSGNSNN